MRQLILAHDLGTTGDKATLFDEEGKLVASAFCPYETHYPNPGCVEQNPQDWWKAVCSSTRQVIRDSRGRPSDVKCVTFSAHTMGCLPVNRAGEPLRWAIIWADQRAVSEAERIGHKIDPAVFYRITGHRMEACYSLPKMLWIRRTEDAIYRDAYKFLNAKDFIISRFTGAFLTDEATASVTNAFDIAERRWSETIVRTAELDPDKLPTVCSSTKIAGGVTPEASRESGLVTGTPVVLGGGDGACGTLGAGAYYPGAIYAYLGSSAWIAMSADEPGYDRERRTAVLCHVVPGMYFESGTMQAAGASIDWARQSLYGQAGSHHRPIHEVYERLSRDAAAAPKGAKGLLFLPYLMGERCPWWDNRARGAFVGLTIRHTRSDMMRAVFEGVMFNLRLILEVFQSRGASLEVLPVIGGGAKNRLWLTIMADITGVPVRPLRLAQEATSMGAAVVGGVGVRIYRDFSVISDMITGLDPITPDLAAHSRYTVLYSTFKQLYSALAPVNEAISGIHASRCL